MSLILCDGRQAWLQMFQDLKSKGRLVNPRGQETLEIENYHVEINPLRDRFCSFEERKLSLRYLAGELAWYLGADSNDTWIEVLSSFWTGLKNPYEPRWNSNYGVQIFKAGQFQHCFKLLSEDMNTRQAVMVLNSATVALSDSKDKICTNAVMFRIRDNRLNMTVQMRSNDIIFGLGYDLPIFSIIMEMLYVKLRVIYPDLELGTYHHTSGSFHIYQKHFGMMEKILANDGENYNLFSIETISFTGEVITLLEKYPVWAKKAAVTRKVDFAPRHTMIRTLLGWIAEQE